MKKGVGTETAKGCSDEQWCSNEQLRTPGSSAEQCSSEQWCSGEHGCSAEQLTIPPLV